MDATVFDGTRTAHITAGTVPTSTGFAWYDVDLARTTPGQAHEVADLLTSIGVATADQALLLKPNRSAAMTVTDDGASVVLWVGGTTPGAAPPEVHLLWSPTWLVTVRWGGTEAIDTVRKELAARAQRLFADPSQVLSVTLTLLNTTVDRRLTHLDLTLYRIEDAIVGEGRSSTVGSVPQRLRVVRSEVSALQLRYAALVDVAAAAVVDPSALPGMTTATADGLKSYVTHLSDTYHHVKELAEGARGAMQDYQTAISDRQGDRINQLTIVSVLFLPISFLTGYFGMNFTWLDNQLLSMASWVLWGLLLPVLVLALSVGGLHRFGYLRAAFNRPAKAEPDAHAPVPAGLTHDLSAATQPTPEQVQGDGHGTASSG